jgi:hypothetical protein
MNHNPINHMLVPVEFNPLDIQYIDASGYYTLNPDYVLSYSYRDGFTERLLSLDIYVDVLFTCKVRVDYHKKQGNNYSPVSAQFETILPENIKQLIVQLTEQNALHLKHYYADTTMDDAGDTHFVINHEGTSHNVGIGIFMKKPVIENTAERLLFQLVEEMEKLREEFYKHPLPAIRIIRS